MTTASGEVSKAPKDLEGFPYVTKGVSSPASLHAMRPLLGGRPKPSPDPNSPILAIWMLCKAP